MIRRGPARFIWLGTQSLRARWIAIAWGLAVMGFVIAGTASLADQWANRKNRAEGAWASTDFQLQEATLEPVRAEAVVSALQKIPPDEPILFANYPEASDRGNLRLYSMQTLLSYLAWPRQVLPLGCGEIGTYTTQTHLEGVVLFRAPPGRWSASGESIGSKLIVIPLSRIADWGDFCRS